jgi:hypothetical protein
MEVKRSHHREFPARGETPLNTRENATAATSSRPRAGMPGWAGAEQDVGHDKPGSSRDTDNALQMTELGGGAATCVPHQHATLLTRFRVASSGCGRSALFAKSASGDPAGRSPGGILQTQGHKYGGARPVFNIPCEPSLDASPRRLFARSLLCYVCSSVS